MLKILVFGAGAIGCFIGGRLSVAGHQVTLVGRESLMQKIATDGLTLLHPDQPPRKTKPHTTTMLESADDFDFILLTVKAPAIPAAIEQLITASLNLTNSALVALQNGIGSEDQLIAVFGPDKVIAGTITIPISVPEPGVIEVSKAKGGLGLAKISRFGEQKTNQLAHALNQAGLTTKIYNNYQAMKWSKLLLNIVNNATSAILNQPPIEIISQPKLFDMEIEALQEGLAVMKAMRLEPVKLPGYPVDWLGRLLSAGVPKSIKRTVLRPFLVSGRGNKMPSLQIDLASGRGISEIESLNGAIVRAGQAYNIPTPVNLALTKILSGIVTGQLSWHDYQAQPEKLLGTVIK